jgi:hypothetical protein
MSFGVNVNAAINRGVLDHYLTLPQGNKVQAMYIWIDGSLASFSAPRPRLSTLSPRLLMVSMCFKFIFFN